MRLDFRSYSLGGLSKLSLSTHRSSISEPSIRFEGFKTVVQEKATSLRLHVLEASLQISISAQVFVRVCACAGVSFFVVCLGRGGGGGGGGWRQSGLL